MILSAVSLWKKFDVSNPLNPEERNRTEDKAAGMVFSDVVYSGRAAEDGDVRIFAMF